MWCVLCAIVYAQQASDGVQHDGSTPRFVFEFQSGYIETQKASVLGDCTFYTSFLVRYKKG